MTWLKCKQCGQRDKTDKTVIPHHIGTKTTMRCPDCANDYGYASMCRNCCPTEHGTKFEEWDDTYLYPKH